MHFKDSTEKCSYVRIHQSTPAILWQQKDRDAQTQGKEMTPISQTLSAEIRHLHTLQNVTATTSF